MMMPYHTKLQQFAAGRDLFMRENLFFAKRMRLCHGQMALQLGETHRPLLDFTPLPRKIYAAQEGNASLLCDFTLLPLPSASVDVVVLPHTLNLQENAPAMIAEVARVLVAGGFLFMATFNFASLWRLPYALRLPKGGHFYAPSLINQWLNDYGLRIAEAEFLVYTPFCRHEKWLNKLAWLNTAGNRWWPHFAAAHVLCARKIASGLRPICDKYEYAPQINWAGETLLGRKSPQSRQRF